MCEEDNFSGVDAEEMRANQIFEEAAAGFWRDKEGFLHRIKNMDNTYLMMVSHFIEKKGLFVPDTIRLEIEFRGKPN